MVNRRRRPNLAQLVPPQLVPLQLVPLRPTLGPQPGYDDRAPGTGLASIVPVTMTWQVLVKKKPLHRPRNIRLHQLRGQEWSTKMSNGAPRNYAIPP
jgi:hypothetical protein